MDKVWIVFEDDHDNYCVRGVYDSVDAATEHSEAEGLRFEEHELLRNVPVEFKDSPAKRQKRTDEATQARISHSKRQELEAVEFKRKAEFDPVQFVANGGRLSLCHCEVFSKDSHFKNSHGHCSYCGGTIFKVFRQILGETALQQAIDLLDYSNRIAMRRIVA